MRDLQARHYTEEELLMHVLHEEAPEMRRVVSDHLEKCSECRSVFQEYRALVVRFSNWTIPAVPEDVWRERKANLLDQFHQDQEWLQRGKLIRMLERRFQKIWDYALENPLPTLGYIAVAIAFASERTLTVLRLDRILPATSELFEILRQVL
jgi:anti-sigma factor RsiW